ncbi:MAG: GAF domain-containing protein [Gammaproteobacteria bacterium]|nr:GAF domain-containing protein [Gammaproteobacteria bacterium]
MRVGFFLENVGRQTRKLWPRKIVHKVALTNIVILLITIGGLSWYSLIERSAYQAASTVNQYKEYAAQIAGVSRNFIASGRVEELEEVVSSFMMVDGTYDIYIKDVAFNTLIALRNSKDKRVTVFQEEQKRIAPVASGQYTAVHDGILEVWQQIAPANPLGWIYISRRMDPFGGLTMEFLKISITALLLSIAVCLLIVQRILREPMQSLRRATEFSEWLDMAQGNHLQLQTGSREVERLIHTLNRTSEKLFQNGLSQKRRHLLVDTIRDIQTRYIEKKNIKELNERILKQMVHLSESEYGFFGDVKQGFRGKPFIKIHTFSKLGQNVSIQRFVEKYSPPNMEFHNSHNLFGAVLQTKKPTIANDPSRDPRSGGLPPGHPPLHSFLALPVLYDDRIVSVIGIANRRGGYDQSLVDYLQPLLNTIGHVVVAGRLDNQKNRTIQDLEQKEVLLRRILATVSDSIVTINAGGFIETVNPATEKMFGYLREEMINQHINRLIPELFHQEFREQYAASDASKYHESEGRRKDGSCFAVEFTVSEFKIGDAEMFTVTIIDLSHLQNLGSIFTQADQALVNMQRMVHAGTWELDLKTKQIAASNETYHIFAIEKRGFKLQYFVNAICVEDQPLLVLAIERCILDNEPFIIDVRVPVTNSTPKFVQIQGNPQLDGELAVTRIIGVVQDVTDSRQQIKMKDEFITSVSEEIRSPLTSIRGSIGMLSGEVSKYISEKEKFLLDTAYQNTDRLLLFINDILDIENIATGKTAFNLEFLEFKKLLDTLLMANSEVAKEYRVNITAVVKNKDIVLIADKQRLVQLFSILISNAARHSPLGASVEITAGIVDGALQVVIKDYGEGIPIELHENLFNLYARTRYFHAEHPESTGLGLCIAKSIIDRHAGSISFESHPGKGTVLYVRLPVPQQNVAVLSR